MDQSVRFGLASIDLYQRLRMGESARIEQYVDLLRGVDLDPARLEDLILTEFLGRLFQGDDPPFDEYAERYAEVWSDLLRNKLSEVRNDPANDPAIPRFRKIGPHRRGGNGEVSLAFDRELRRCVALKEASYEWGVKNNAIDRFRREAAITAQLDHPGIVSVYSCGVGSDGRPFYAMRFVAGPTLEDEIRMLERDRPRGRTFPINLRALLGGLVDACQAVAYAHSKGIIHLDLKPGNIHLGPFGETVVIDWGLARCLNERVEVSNPLGTPAYMSPEQAINQPDQFPLSPATDVFNLGATLYHLITGRPPYVTMARSQESSNSSPVKARSDQTDGGKKSTLQHRHTSDADLACRSIDLSKVRTCNFPSPRSLVKRIDRNLEAIILKAMSPDPRCRYPSPLVLAQDIDAWLASEPVSARREPWPTRAGRWVMRHRLLTGSTAASIALSCVVALIGWLIYKNTESTRRAQLTRVVLSQIDDATRLAAEARLNNDRAKWAEAVSAAKHANNLIAGVPVPSLSNRVAAVLKSLELEQSAARRAAEIRERDQKMELALDEARLMHADSMEGDRFSPAPMISAYHSAFRAYGIDLFKLSEAESKVRASAIRGPLVAAIDNWATFGEPSVRDRLIALASRIDLDPFRIELRDALAKGDLVQLRRLSEMPEADILPPSTLALLGLRLSTAKDEEKATALLERAWRKWPGDFFINITLAAVYSQSAPPRLEEAIRFCSSAVSIRPGSPGGAP